MALEIERIGTTRHDQPIGMLARTHILWGDDPQDPGDDCSGRGWIIDPPYQRGAVWALAQKRAWIESILMGVGLPAIFVNRFPRQHPVYGWREVVIDGQQRLRATAEFMDDGFTVRGELWSAQSPVFQRVFRTSGGICCVVYCKYETDRECAELYLRLLRAGTAHTSEEIKKAVDYLAACGP